MVAMTASYEIRTRRNLTLEIHNVTRVRLKSREVFFYGSGGDVEFVLSMANHASWIRRVPATAEDADENVVELRYGGTWGTVEASIPGVEKIGIKKVDDRSSVYVLKSGGCPGVC
jgi:hypothetical protein